MRPHQHSAHQTNYEDVTWLTGQVRDARPVHSGDLRRVGGVAATVARTTEDVTLVQDFATIGHLYCSIEDAAPPVERGELSKVLTPVGASVTRFADSLVSGGAGIPA